MLSVVRHVLRRAWAAPLYAHVATLAVLLLALIPVVGTSASFSPDEGAVVIQARSVAEGDGWIVEHPLDRLDPENRFYPLGASTQGERGKAPFAKHPIYPLVLAALHRVGGVGAMVTLSVAGTVAAAGLAALLVREVAGDRERPVLWAVGVGSPLVFDAYLLIAHSVGAALVTAAVLVALRATRRRRLVALMVGAASLAAAGVLFRSEALIFALALGAGVVATGAARRRPALAGWGVALPLPALAAAVGERWLQRALIGADGGSVAPPAVPGGFVGSRVEAFLNTWIRPSASVPGTADLALLAAAVLVAAAVVAARRRRSTRLLGALSITATAFSAFAFLADPDRVVPGLLVAFPLAVVGIGLADRTYLDQGGRLLLTVTTSLFVTGVLATQYREGGSAEWGGRYFALAVPVVVVLAVDAAARRAPSLPVETRRWAGAGLATCSVLLAVGAVVSLDRAHAFTGLLVERIHTTARTTAPGDGGNRPVVVSAYPNIPRLAWPTFARGRWLHAPHQEQGEELAALLADEGVEELVFVGQQPEDLAPYLDRYRVDDRRSFAMGRWQVSVLVGAR